MSELGKQSASASQEEALNGMSEWAEIVDGKSEVLTLSENNNKHVVVETYRVQVIRDDGSHNGKPHYEDTREKLDVDLKSLNDDGYKTLVTPLFSLSDPVLLECVNSYQVGGKYVADMSQVFDEDICYLCGSRAECHDGAKCVAPPVEVSASEAYLKRHATDNHEETIKKLHRSIHRLVRLNNHEAKFGKDSHFYEEHSLAWKEAKHLLFV